MERVSWKTDSAEFILIPFVKKSNIKSIFYS